ncbi:MAG: class I SAM-dependent methyltransferase [Cyanobacteria bacterium P01_G01_bin.39]
MTIEVSSLLKNIYRCADKSQWYSSVAKAYDRTRPRYPREIWLKMQEFAQLQPGKSVLEIGSGPGIASIELAKFGVNLVCLEPSEVASKLARSKCSAYSRVEVVNSTFEDWELANRQFDVVVATTSYHWVSPEIRNQKAAAALKDGGLLVLLWNTPPQPSYEIHQSMVEIYQNYAPELAKYESHQSHEGNLTLIGDEVINSGYFRDLTSDKIISQITYSVNDYLTLLSTLSPYIRLESKKRSHLFAELEKVLIHNYGNKLELHYLSLIQIAIKV